MNRSAWCECEICAVALWLDENPTIFIFFFLIQTRYDNIICYCMNEWKRCVLSLNYNKLCEKADGWTVNNTFAITALLIVTFGVRPTIATDVREYLLKSTFIAQMAVEKFIIYFILFRNWMLVSLAIKSSPCCQKEKEQRKWKMKMKCVRLDIVILSLCIPKTHYPPSPTRTKIILLTQQCFS